MMTDALPDLTVLLTWTMSGEGRLVAAGLLFLLMWALKSLPIARDLLSTPRRKQAAALFLSLAPAVYMLARGAQWQEVIATAVGIALAAHGVNSYRRAPSREDLARAMFAAYSESAGGLTHDGKPIPSWGGLTDRVRASWLAAAGAVQ